jgi:putative ABC transport system permease protein
MNLGVVFGELETFSKPGRPLEPPYLDAPFLYIIFLALGSLVLSALAGPLASLYAALKISRAETYFTMREGE